MDGLREKLIGNYASEISFLLKLKDEEIMYLESRVWDFTDSEESDTLVHIDDVLKELTTRLTRLESDEELDLNDFNY